MKMKKNQIKTIENKQNKNKIRINATQ